MAPAARTAGLTWESVLAGVEADLLRTEEFVRAAHDQRGPGVQLTPVDVMYPGAAPNLPDPAEMPSVPLELLGRVQALRERLSAASQELTDALADLGRHLSSPALGSDRHCARGTSNPPVARFLDRTG